MTYLIIIIIAEAALIGCLLRGRHISRKAIRKLIMDMHEHRIDLSNRIAKQREYIIQLRDGVRQIAAKYEQLSAHSLIRCARCGRMTSHKTVHNTGNYYVCENCEAKQWK